MLSKTTLHNADRVFECAAPLGLAPNSPATREPRNIREEIFERCESNSINLSDCHHRTTNSKPWGKHPTPKQCRKSDNLLLMKSEDKTPRSPLDGKIISRQPAQSLLWRFQFDGISKLLYTLGFAWGMIFTLVALGIFAKWSPRVFWVALVTLFVVALCLAAWEYWRYRKMQHSLIMGITGEKYVADELDRLKQFGFEIVHDIPGRRPESNIDHVAVGPQGVFVVETKNRSKSGNQVIEYDGITLKIGGIDRTEEIRAQVAACCTDISELIKSAMGEAVHVRGVAMFPNWKVNYRSTHSPLMWVFNPTTFVENIPKHKRVLDRKAVESIAWHLRNQSHLRAQLEN